VTPSRESQNGCSLARFHTSYRGGSFLWRLSLLPIALTLTGFAVRASLDSLLTLRESLSAASTFTVFPFSKRVLSWWSANSIFVYVVLSSFISLSIASSYSLPLIPLPNYAFDLQSLTQLFCVELWFSLTSRPLPPSLPFCNRDSPAHS